MKHWSELTIRDECKDAVQPSNQGWSQNYTAQQENKHKEHKQEKKKKNQAEQLCIATKCDAEIAS